jgi:hypothetical protein
VKQPKYIHNPQHDRNHHDGVENSLDRALHWNVAIHEPKQNAYNNERQHNVDKGHFAFSNQVPSFT